MSLARLMSGLILTQTVSNEMLSLIREVHSKPAKWDGNSLLEHLPRIQVFIEDNKAETLLDYGCGKAIYHPEHWNITKYDPGVEEYSTKPPGTFDIVICTDVMEHVEPEYIDQVLDEIFAYADKLVYICIGLDPAEEILSDGRNAHISLLPASVWQSKLNAASKKHKVKYYIRWGLSKK